MYNSKMYWRIWIFLGVLVFVFMVLIKGSSIDIYLAITASSAAGISLLIESLLFKQWIWKKRPNLFYPWLCTIPYIGGKWKGFMYSDYIDPITNKVVDPIPTMMEIRHEFDKITVTLESAKSYSSSYTSTIWIDEAGRRYLCYTYYNDADMNRDTNPNHDGTAKLRIRLEDNSLFLEGHYFTGRKTTGKMTFERVSTKNSAV
ncbi:hypothetical protein PTI45_04033 [Paenibacillus nuruki]|uniref:CD-NTase-associated protein 15 domain-containing protein n=1 Tax=Paenibacillus nuruki TaxID=1886670 RepID=A0A1E3KZ44_9BACL|nr:hypothetical protein [Paenibacillus nuruki]ODP26611.1 hypothetical protein PTI45_04033 [Paenibacillus nuruki]